MHIYPIEKLIIIYGLHIDQIQNHTSEERLITILKEKSFIVTNDLSELAIVVYKSSVYTDHSKLTHIITNYRNEITEIKYYTKNNQ
jgi:hypothetical protein